MLAVQKGQRAPGNEISGDNDEVGREFVDTVNDVLEEDRLGELVEVNIGDLGDAKTVKRPGKIADPNCSFDEIELVAGDLS